MSQMSVPANLSLDVRVCENLELSVHSAGAFFLVFCVSVCGIDLDFLEPTRNRRVVLQSCPLPMTFCRCEFGPVHGVAVASGGRHCHLAPLLRSSPQCACSDSGQCSKQHADDMIAEARCPSKITQHTYIYHKIRTAAVLPSMTALQGRPLECPPECRGRAVNMYQYGARVVWELRQPLHQPRGCTVCMTG